jgi:hypothetical protein
MPGFVPVTRIKGGGRHWRPNRAPISDQRPARLHAGPQKRIRSSPNANPHALCQIDYFRRFLKGGCERFFAIKMLSGLHRSRTDRNVLKSGRHIDNQLYARVC